MKAEISRFRYKDDQSFSGVYFKQGQHIQDSELNAITTYLKRQVENLGVVAINNGTPRRDGLIDIVEELPEPFKGWKARFRPNGGTVVADGVVAEALPNFSDTAFSIPNQKALLGGEFEFPETAFVYVDIWDQIKDAYMLPDLIDPGLNGALGACISERVAQVKICQSSDLIMDAAQCGTKLELPQKGNGLFDISLRSGSQLEDACDPCADLVDISLTTSNLLFRVEVHDVVYDSSGFPLEVHLKWSRENGAITFQVPTSGAALPQLDKSFAYEFFNEETEQNMGFPAGGYDHKPLRGEIVTDLAERPEHATHYRRWDGYATIDLMTDALKSGWDRGVELSKDAAGSAHGRFEAQGNNGPYVFNLSEFVISLDLVDRNIMVGDFWLALARSNAPEGEKIRVLSDLPLGIKHHYCYLGEVIFEEEDSYIRIDQAEDKQRLEFPDLSCLHAGDITFKSQECEKLQDVDNVQDALDALCQAIPEYHTLKMSCGTGQSGYLNEKFPSKLQVLVEDQNGWPVVNAKVAFTCIRPTGAGDLGGALGFRSDGINEIQGHVSYISANAGATFDPAEPPDRTHSGATDILQGDVKINGTIETRSHYRLVIETDDSGYACVDWIPRSVAGPRTVHVALEQAPQGLSGALYYCGFAEKREPVAPKLPTLNGISWVSDRNNYHNDNTVKLERVLRGFEIHFSEALRTGPDYRNAFRLFIDFVRGGDEAAIETKEICSKIETAENRLIIRPNQTGLKDIAESNHVTDCLPRGFRFRMELDGRFIFTKSGDNIDAFVPTNPTSDNKFIALDWSDAGLGHISDFKSWFYLAINKPDPVKEVPINTVSQAVLTRSKLFKAAESARLVQHQPHWQTHSEIFEFLQISDRARVADIQTQIVFKGFKPRPKKKDVLINLFNKEQFDSDVFTPVQLEKILPNQPHWENLDQVISSLGIRGQARRQILETRLNFRGFKAKIEPVKKDVIVNKKSESELLATELFTPNDVKIIIRQQPHWKDPKQLLLAMGFDRTRTLEMRKRLKAILDRVSYDGYQEMPPPKKNVTVNTMTIEQLMGTGLFSQTRAAQIVNGQPHWKDENALFARFGITNNDAKSKLSARLNFAEYQGPAPTNDTSRFFGRDFQVGRQVRGSTPASLFGGNNQRFARLRETVDNMQIDVKVNIFNLDELLASGVFDKTQAAAIFAKRPHWKNVKQVLVALKITDATKISILEKRLNFEGFGKDVPVKETPKVSINKGTQKELESIPDINARLARSIIKNRPYGKIEELEKTGLRAPQIQKLKRFVKL